MTSKLERLSTGLKTDFLGTLARLVKYLFRQLVFLVEEFLFYLYRALLLIPSARTKAKLKHALNPVVRLDYSRHAIFLHADSDLGVYRSHACAKEPETVEWIEHNIRPGEVFYDIGANVGAYSLVAAKYLKNQVQIHAFEPSFSTYDQLCQNVVLNDCQDIIHPNMIALAEQTGLLTFFYRSLEGGSAEHFSSSDTLSVPVELTPVYKQQMLGFSLDTLIDQYHFPLPQHIKLDVDGAEFGILKGACGTLKDGGVKSILVEVRTSDGIEKNIVNYLSSFGFELSSRFDRGDGVIWNDIFMKV